MIPAVIPMPAASSPDVSTLLAKRRRLDISPPPKPSQLPISIPLTVTTGSGTVVPPRRNLPLAGSEARKPRVPLPTSPARPVIHPQMPSSQLTIPLVVGVGGSRRRVQFKSPPNESTPQHIRQIQAGTREGTQESGPNHVTTAQIAGPSLAPPSKTIAIVDITEPSSFGSPGEFPSPLDPSRSPFSSFESTPKNDDVFDPSGPPIESLTPQADNSTSSGSSEDNDNVEFDRSLSIEPPNEGPSEPRWGSQSGGKRKREYVDQNAVERQWKGLSRLPGGKRRKEDPGADGAYEPAVRVFTHLFTPRGLNHGKQGWVVRPGSAAAFHLVTARAGIEREATRNARLLAHLLGTQQLIGEGIERLDDCLDRFAKDGVDLGQYQQ